MAQMCGERSEHPAIWFINVKRPTRWPLLWCMIVHRGICEYIKAMEKLNI